MLPTVIVWTAGFRCCAAVADVAGRAAAAIAMEILIAADAAIEKRFI